VTLSGGGITSCRAPWHRSRSTSIAWKPVAARLQKVGVFLLEGCRFWLRYPLARLIRVRDAEAAAITEVARRWCQAFRLPHHLQLPVSDRLVHGISAAAISRKSPRSETPKRNTDEAAVIALAGRQIHRQEKTLIGLFSEPQSGGDLNSSLDFAKSSRWRPEHAWLVLEC